MGHDKFRDLTCILRDSEKYYVYRLFMEFLIIIDQSKSVFDVSAFHPCKGMADAFFADRKFFHPYFDILFGN